MECLIKQNSLLYKIFHSTQEDCIQSLINTRSHNLLQYSVVQTVQILLAIAYYLIPVIILHMSIKFTIRIHYISLSLISGFRHLPRRCSFGPSRNLSSPRRRKDCVTSPKSVCEGGYKQNNLSKAPDSRSPPKLR